MAKVAATKKTAPAPKRKVEKPKGEVLYEKIKVEVCIGESALTAAKAKKLLGWRESEDKAMFKDKYGKGVICDNVVHNRFRRMSWIDVLVQEILRKRWRFNFQNVIIGKYGAVVTGQHRLISLVLAAQQWEIQSEDWKHLWPEAPTIETSIGFGMDEDEETVRTIDTGLPQTLADVFFRSAYFAKLPTAERQKAAQIAEQAVKTLWWRTGVGKGDRARSFDPTYRTHAESMDFVARHPRLIDAVKHIHSEAAGKEAKIGSFIRSGWASALLYMMGCSNSDPAEYRKADMPNEKMLDWGLWDKAEEFFVLLNQPTVAFKPLTEARGRMLEEGKDSNYDRAALLCKAWLQFASGGAITHQTLKIDYTKTEDGGYTLAENAVVGGIDLGDPTTSDEGEPDENEIKKGVEARKAIVDKEKHAAAVNGKPKPAKKAPAEATAKPATAPIKPLAPPVNPADKGFRMGQVVWVCHRDDEEPFQAKILALYTGMKGGRWCKFRIEQGFQGAGNSQTCPVESLRAEQPSPRDLAAVS